VPIPQRLVPALKTRLDGRPPGAPAIASPRGSRATHMRRYRVGRVPISACCKKPLGHASITVTAHTYADLFDDELDNIAAALDSLSDDLSHRK